MDTEVFLGSGGTPYHKALGTYGGDALPSVAAPCYLSHLFGGQGFDSLFIFFLGTIIFYEALSGGRARLTFSGHTEHYVMSQ